MIYNFARQQIWTLILKCSDADDNILFIYWGEKKNLFSWNAHRFTVQHVCFSWLRQKKKAPRKKHQQHEAIS